MGVYDNPAIIEMVTNVTGVRRMYYVGHSMGGTSLAIMLSERPEYNERISTAFLLAPALYLGSTLKYLQPFFKSVNYYQVRLPQLRTGWSEKIDKGKDFLIWLISIRDSHSLFSQNLFLLPHKPNVKNKFSGNIPWEYSQSSGNLLWLPENFKTLKFISY